MQTFDYARAWREAAQPGFLSLSDHARALYDRVRVECAGLAQTANLSMPWPEGLRQAFEAIPTDELARAARILHAYDHWRPAGVRQGEPITGAGWQFANYADQVLAERLGLRSRFERDGNGSSLRVLEGSLRRGYSDRDSWQWEEIGRATPENVARSQAEPDPVPGLTQAERWETEKKRDALWKALRAELLAADPCPYFRACVDVSAFMFESVKCGQCYRDVRAENARKVGLDYAGAPKWIGAECGCLTKQAKSTDAPDPIPCLCSECGHEWTVYTKPRTEDGGALYCSHLCRANAFDRMAQEVAQEIINTARKAQEAAKQ